MLASAILKDNYLCSPKVWSIHSIIYPRIAWWLPKCFAFQFFNSNLYFRMLPWHSDILLRQNTLSILEIVQYIQNCLYFIFYPRNVQNLFFLPSFKHFQIVKFHRNCWQIILTFKTFLHIIYHSKHFACHKFTYHKSEFISLSPCFTHLPCYRGWNWGSESLNNLIKLI